MSAEQLHGRVELYRFNEANDTYSSSCVLNYNGDTVVVKGLSSRITNADWRELYNYLQQIGVKNVIYDRRKAGRTIPKSVKIKGA
jgi:hypothetical protein